MSVSKEERKKSKPKTKTKTEACNDAIAIGPVLSWPLDQLSWLASSISPKMKRLWDPWKNNKSLTIFKLVGIIIKIHVSSLYTFVLCSTSLPFDSINWLASLWVGNWVKYEAPVDASQSPSGALHRVGTAKQACIMNL